MASSTASTKGKGRMTKRSPTPPNDNEFEEVPSDSEEWEDSEDNNVAEDLLDDPGADDNVSAATKAPEPSSDDEAIPPPSTQPAKRPVQTRKPTVKSTLERVEKQRAVLLSAKKRQRLEQLVATTSQASSRLLDIADKEVKAGLKKGEPSGQVSGKARKQRSSSKRKKADVDSEVRHLILDMS